MLLLLLSVFFISAVLSYAYIHYAKQRNWLDVPNERSSHVHITPRGGGVVFVGLWMLIIFYALARGDLFWKQIAIFLPGLLIVTVVGFYDDCRSIPVRWRALAYLFAAILSVIALQGFSNITITANLYLSLGSWGSVLAILAIVWSINLFNFMDGIDGIAAVEALFVLGVGGFILWQAGASTLSMLAWTLAAAVCGFLIWNKSPARLFMGDAGSTALGFSIMLLALYSEKEYGIPALLWAILYGIFIFDATITLIRRFLKEKPGIKPIGCMLFKGYIKEAIPTAKSCGE